MDLQAVVQLIGNVGFPIALSLILLQTILIKFNKQMDGLEKRLAQLDKTMNLMVKTYHQSTSKSAIRQDKKKTVEIRLSVSYEQINSIQLNGVYTALCTPLYRIGEKDLLQRFFLVRISLVQRNCQGNLGGFSSYDYLV
ncbi:hypothetical protein NYE24_20540 [Paenibacillus sp. FSL H7-0350]|uniref:hypothetical protein n=1 Tax=Paenibacillus sp. FSL H7-0350 TaxID=2975345 RepID=UPI003158FD6E